MGIIEYIERQQKRPEKHRHMIALTYASSLTAVVFVVWLSVLLPRDSARNAVVAQAGRGDTESFAETFKEVSQGYSDFKEEFNDTAEGFQQAAAAAAARQDTGGDSASTTASSTENETGSFEDSNGYDAPAAGMNGL